MATRKGEKANFKKGKGNLWITNDGKEGSYIHMV